MTEGGRTDTHIDGEGRRLLDKDTHPHGDSRGAEVTSASEEEAAGEWQVKGTRGEKKTGASG